ncbi:MAG: transcriptional regulator [Elusimicrobia bacterium RIFOXYA2_FULL_40_6]|nr:MAG: transcriptional regulator [Elusimicrobia bacterium RIFOXYA2_FULL_40_6]
MDEIYKLHAEVCKTLASPVRLKIINSLRTGKMSAGELIEKTKINKVILSQHMALLSGKGVIKAERSGKNVFYQLQDPQIIKACDIMRNVLVKHLEKNRELLNKLKK